MRPFHWLLEARGSFERKKHKNISLNVTVSMSFIGSFFSNNNDTHINLTANTVLDRTSRSTITNVQGIPTHTFFHKIHFFILFNKVPENLIAKQHHSVGELFTTTPSYLHLHLLFPIKYLQLVSLHKNTSNKDKVGGLLSKG